MTDTIGYRYEPLAPNIKVISVAPLFAEAILSIHRRESVSRLFKEEGTSPPTRPERSRPSATLRSHRRVGAAHTVRTSRAEDGGRSPPYEDRNRSVVVVRRSGRSIRPR